MGQLSSRKAKICICGPGPSARKNELKGISSTKWLTLLPFDRQTTDSGASSIVLQPPAKSAAAANRIAAVSKKI